MERRITRLEDILNRGESQDLELKAEVPSPDILARNIAAFANAEGGTIALGIDERLREITPVPGGKARNHYERARSLLSPEPDTELYQVASLRGTVICIDVAPTEVGPVAVGGVILKRDGAQIRPATANELPTMLVPPPDAGGAGVPAPWWDDRLMAMLADQSAKLEEIYQGQLQARTWRSRLPDILVSGIVGAVLGVVLSALFL